MNRWTKRHGARRWAAGAVLAPIFLAGGAPALGGRSAAAASCPERLAIAAVADQRAAIEREWFAEGGRTGGGIVVTMEALPQSRRWTGARLTETVRLDPDQSDCPLPRPERICGTGENARFVVGARGDAVRLPIGVAVPWTIPPGRRAGNSFPDVHFVLDSGGGRPGGVDLLGVLPEGVKQCTITCRQIFRCGSGAAAVAYPPFIITYRFKHERYERRLPDGRRNPLSKPVWVTRVEAEKG